MQSWAVVQFPGSNSDTDAYRVCTQLPATKVTMHWHDEPIQKNQYHVIILPGGFSYGDHLRAGAIAKFSKALENLEEVIEAGAHVLGICNGFQILLECRLLPGFLQVNESLHFISRQETIEIKTPVFPWFTPDNKDQKLRLPIAHSFGSYQVSDVDRSEIKVVLKYQNNPNGSREDIAGVYRKMGKGSVLGMMPHPERQALPGLQNRDGWLFWENARKALSS